MILGAFNQKAPRAARGLFLALTLGMGAPALAQDTEAGRQVAGMCRTCHGLDGYARIPIAPHIGGESAEYIEAQLRAFRSGTRQHEMMSVVAASLGDQQIADVAAWFASQTPAASLPPGTSDADAPASCVACHGANGIAVVPGVPNLAGETNIYIQTQLEAFRTGKRQSEVMVPIAQSLSPEEIRAVADWFAAIRFEIVEKTG